MRTQKQLLAAVSAMSLVSSRHENHALLRPERLLALPDADNDANRPMRKKSESVYHSTLPWLISLFR